MRITPIESIISEPVKYRVLAASNNLNSRNTLQNLTQRMDKLLIQTTDKTDNILQLLKDESYHLLILEVDAIDDNYKKLITDIKSSFNQFPVILIIDQDIRNKSEFFDLLPDDYVYRPLNEKDLAFRINRTLKYFHLQKTRKSLEKENKELWGKAITDKLTGLYNRQYFEEIYSGEFERTKRYRSQIGCLLFDIDHFKKINDDYGHLIGDEVLAELGSIVLGTIRKVDIAARYGGEEFVILMPETTREGTRHVGERIRKLIAEYKFGQNSKALKTPMRQVTVSLGAVHYPDEQIFEPMILLKMVDEALYRAKKKGRNRLETTWNDDQLDVQ